MNKQDIIEDIAREYAKDTLHLPVPDDLRRKSSILDAERSLKNIKSAGYAIYQLPGKGEGDV